MAVIINGTTGITNVDGSASAPAITGADTDTGTWFPAVNTLAWSTGGSERMRIDSSGNLLVGGTSVAASCKTTISTSNDNQLAINCTTASGTVYSSIIFSQAGTNKTQLYQDHGATRFYITNASAGVYLASGGTSWTSASDERVKENLVPIADGLNKVASLRAVTGNYISDETKKSRSFLIAQDVEAVLPEAVDHSNPDELGLAYTDVIPLLVASIKELKADLDATKAELQALKAGQ